jgi:SAM-dependent methyltransferase
MSYNPGEYWTERGKVYKQNFKYDENFKLQEQILVDYLKKFSFSTVLEVGCGFGRVTRLLLSNFPHIKEYFAFDLSPHQIENAKLNIQDANVGKEKIKFMVSDIQSFQSEKGYDLVVASEVFMHILPSEINGIIRKLTNFSNEHVCNIDWYEEKPPKKAESFNFIHQYEQIYGDIPSVKKVYRIPIVKKGLLSKVDSKQSIFHAILANKTS